MPGHSWDARSYDRVAAPQERWGARVIDRLALSGDETVLDAGCGSGRVTALLLERLPRGRVIALDADPGMLEAAMRRLAGDPRVRFIEADLGRPLPLDEPVDAVLSTATFHWVPDHDALFAGLAAVMRSGGRLEAQCGGPGNLRRLGEAVERTGWPWASVRAFPGPEETAARLESAGFEAVRCWTADEPTVFPGRAELEEFLATVCLGPYRESAGEGFLVWVGQVAGELGGLELDYVRLNMSAVRR